MAAKICAETKTRKNWKNKTKTMNIKTFQGDSFQEGLDKVYAEFGTRAKILHSREVVQSRWFGLRKIRYVEITAAKQDHTENENKQKNETNVETNKINFAEPNIEINSTTDTNTEAGTEYKPELFRLGNKNFDRNLTRNNSTTQNSSIYESDLDNQNLQNKFSREHTNELFFEANNWTNNRTNDQLKNPPQDQLSDSVQDRVRFGSGVQRVGEMKIGFVPIGGWRRMELSELNPTLLQRNLLMLMEEFVQFGGPIDFSLGRRVVVALVGATGVGKTSTIAKLAAYYKLREGRRVGLLTSDVFRIAAVDQLQRYADMLEIEFETVSGADRVQAALRRLVGCELVLIDTPGVNPLNGVKLCGINSILGAAKANEVHLLLSVTSSLPVLLETLNRFAILCPTGVTLTKLDEAVGISEVYKMLKSNQLPLKFFTLGQNISEDIEVAGAARLVSLYQQLTT
jgi:flagellar biosynthesis protein FlhF